MTKAAVEDQIRACGVHPPKIHYNLSRDELIKMAVERGEGCLSEDNILCVKTGAFTGRAAKVKQTVKDDYSLDNVHWAENKSCTPEEFAIYKDLALKAMNGNEIFVQDLYIGAHPTHRMAIRIVTMLAWHSAFVCNMFIVPTAEELKSHKPVFTVWHAPGFQDDPVVKLNLGAGESVIGGGTSYAGEIKKMMFTVMNYHLPDKGVLPMHCSANIGPKGDVAIFFGLSGTGKTTLSADSSRKLIGDDEHGWAGDGVFNFENGCYAKVIHLSRENEPEIYAASTRKNSHTILENVCFFPGTNRIDFDNDSLTENTRSSYPLMYIPNASQNGRGGHPQNIFFLTCDAFGVLPPISRLTPDQAMFQFLSGYTAKVAGTEIGIKEPQTAFSACFGAPFLPRNPEVYAQMLGEKMVKHGADCWLVNTGWAGGAYGIGKRMPIKLTRALVNAALSGELRKAEFAQERAFGLLIPTAVAGVDAQYLNPSLTWADQNAYRKTAADLGDRYRKNMAKFTNLPDPVAKEGKKFGLGRAAKSRAA